MNKESMKRSEKFARKIIKLAVEEKLTINELYGAADMAKSISDNSTVEWEAVAKADFPSRHIIEYPEPLFVPEDSSGTKYSPESSSIARPRATHEQNQ